MKPWSLQIRQRDQKCRGITPCGIPLTGWCKDGMSVIRIVRTKAKKGTLPLEAF